MARSLGRSSDLTLSERTHVVVISQRDPQIGGAFPDFRNQPSQPLIVRRRDGAVLRTFVRSDALRANPCGGDIPARPPDRRCVSRFPKSAVPTAYSPPP